MCSAKPITKPMGAHRAHPTDGHFAAVLKCPAGGILIALLDASRGEKDMRIGIYGASMGSLQQEKTLDVIANNISNVATPGFKKDTVQFKDFISQSTHTRMDQGRIRSTDNPLDIALDGNGFLRVQSDSGVVFTRCGNLTLNKDNQLATQEGWPVLGKNGPIQIPIETKRLHISIQRNGQVFDGNDQIDTLDLARFAPETELVKTNNGYFKPSQGDPVAVQPGECSVLQGSLEEANFSVVEEMTHMIETMRMYEAYQKTLKFFEQEDAQVTSKLGNL
jgi:flagellar basal-body rod protein FlgF